MSLVEATALKALVPFLSAAPWDHVSLLEVAARRDQVLGGPTHGEVVDADSTMNTAFWNVISLLDPLTLPEPERTVAHMYATLVPRIATRFAITDEEARPLAVEAARYLANEVRRITSGRVRVAPPSAARRALLDSCGTRPYCWYCGYRFEQRVAHAFEEGSTQPQVSRVLMVDYMMPRGLQFRDFKIEVDHVVPFSLGGADAVENYRLSCGWCNRQKSALSIMTDAATYPAVFHHPRIGLAFRPVAFWSIRVLATSRQCHVEDCGQGIDSGQLFIAPVQSGGAPVPGNLAAFCLDHDPMLATRMVPASAFG